MPHSEEQPTLSILVVDDEPANAHLLERILRRAGYSQVRNTTSAFQALQMAALEPPDIVLLDLHMPDLSGIEVIQQLRAHDRFTYPLVVVLTGDDSPNAKAEALAAGAKDFITKPFDTTEVLLRIRNLVDLRQTHKHLQHSNEQLQLKVVERTAELEEARLEILERLAMAAEFRDDATGQHTRRVGIIAGRLARTLGFEASEAELIERAAPLHDVGKIAIPDHILLKPGPLDPAEMDVMRTHTTIGAQLLSESRSSLVHTAGEIALSHHERWDRRGYPHQIGGEDIPIAGRIVALADFFDALSHDRPYRLRNPVEEVLRLIRIERGKHFDPSVTDAFLDSFHAYEELSA